MSRDKARKPRRPRPGREDLTVVIGPNGVTATGPMDAETLSALVTACTDGTFLRIAQEQADRTPVYVTFSAAQKDASL